MAKLYRLLVPGALEDFFSLDQFPDQAAQRKKVLDTLASLCRRKLLESHPFPNKKSRFYTLPGTKLEPSSIDYDLALVIWATRWGAHRLTHDELRKITGEERLPHHHVRHCVVTTKQDRKCIMRMYPTSAKRQLILQNLRKKHVPAVRKLPELVEHADLGIAVLVNSTSKKEYLEREIKRAPKKGGAPLVHQARIVVDVVPTSQDFEEWKESA
ncbi:hypothetical protein OAS39_09030 [Pirellulales bacterium]|nr:hypothetical protein [Pirellulales bacterium]